MSRVSGGYWTSVDTIDYLVLCHVQVTLKSEVNGGHEVKLGMTSDRWKMALRYL